MDNISSHAVHPIRVLRREEGGNGGVTTAMSAHRQQIAVVGSGIAGLSCAWLLARRHDVTLFEAAPRLGGHVNTIDVPAPGGPVPVDTGFIVYNEKTYPNLTALFAHLGVATQASEMSFAVSLDDGALEYAGTTLAGLFAQKRNLLRPRFWRMLADLLRFYRAAPRDLGALGDSDLTLGTYLERNGYGAGLRDDHLLPMAAAIWSAGTATLADHPAASFVRFCANHGLLQIANRPEWRAVTGGSAAYVRRLMADFAGTVETGQPIRGVRRLPDCVELRMAAGDLRRFDQVVLATSAPRALALLADADASEQALLSTFGVARNLAVLHSDTTLMPKRRAVWASWNYLGTRSPRPGQDLCVTYWMNRLQSIGGPRPYFVTLNPPRPPAAGTLWHSDIYEHPVFGPAAIGAQRRLWSLQGVRRTWFCGAWFGAGFHEDGLQAGLAVAEQLGGVARPWRVAEPSGRIHAGPAPAEPMQAAA
jgi:predicted NAD/FAD-binding protein